MSLHHVESPSFKKLIHRLTKGRLSPKCRQTLTNQLEQRFVSTKEELKQKLADVNYVCTTADCWTSRRRSFLGMTVHWICPNTLERRGSCLAIRQLNGKHTYDILAKAIEEVNNEFDITDKTCCIVTDSGANFLKAFRHYSQSIETDVNDDEAGTSSSAAHAHVDSENDNDDDEDEMVFHEIQDALDPLSRITSNNDEDEQIVYTLPPHQKCSAHLLNLIATNDAGSNKLRDNAKKICTQTFSKLSALWNKQNRSALAAEKILQTLGVLLVTPGQTRWNSTYDAVVRVKDIISDPEKCAKFDKLCDDLSIKRFTDIQKVFIKEYVMVFKPVCNGLDVLQGDKVVGLGALLPTLTMMKDDLNAVLENPDQPLVVCGPIVSLLIDGINSRFHDVFVSQDAQLAAVVDPRFKLDWIDNENQKSELIELLKRRLRNVQVAQASVADTTQRQRNEEGQTQDTTQGNMAAK